MKNNISCIIPAYNEARTIELVIQTLKKLKREKQIQEIIVVSDGSTDQTAEKAKKAGADKVIDLPKNIGKGGAVLEGVKKAGGEIIVILDADLVGLTEAHIQKLFAPVVAEEVEMAVGFLQEDQLQKVIPQLSGQRAIKKSLLDPLINNKKFQKSGFQFEILLNRYINSLNGKTMFIPFSGIKHLKKEHKYPHKEARFFKTLLAWDLMKAYKNYYFFIFFVILVVLIYLFVFAAPKSLGFSPLALEHPQRSDRILLVVAHPDDEAIGAGGYIADAVAKGALVKVVIVTNGDANKLSARLLDKTLILRPQNLIQEGDSRVKESQKALKSLGLSDSEIIFLGFPDRGLKDLLNQNWEQPKTSKYTKLDRAHYPEAYQYDLPYTGENLTALLAKIISDTQPNIIITHHSQDKNPDHQAVYNFVQLALQQDTIRGLVKAPLVYSFMVHWDILDFPRPFHYKPDALLYPPKELLNSCSWKFYFLNKETEEKKFSAINAYRSQQKSPELRLLLYALVRKNELFCQESPH